MFFKHYKGKYYQVLENVWNVHTEKEMILYTPLYTCEKRLFVREREEFYEDIIIENTLQARFALIGREELPKEVFEFIID